MDSQISWFLIADDIDPTAVNELRSFLEGSGFKVVSGAAPVPPLCKLKALGDKSIELTSRIDDERRKDSPIEVRARFEFNDRSDFLSQLPYKVRALLERTLSYRTLVGSVRSGKTIAFIGSGMSIALGYPSWNALQKILVQEAELVYSDNDLAEGGEKALAIIEACKEKLKERYFDILAREYGEKALGYTIPQTLVLQIPFASYMTTNIDPCLEVAVEHIAGNDKKIQIWPEFTNSNVGSGDIFYLHGKVPRQQQQFRMDRVRMTTGDYREAYTETTFISDLFRHAMMENYVLLFIGYGLREPDIKQLLATVLKHKKAAADFVRKFDILLDADRLHFALMPEGAAAQEDILDLFKNCQVRIIDFPVKDHDYSELDRLIDDLYKRTVSVRVPAIRRFGGVTTIDERGDL